MMEIDRIEMEIPNNATIEPCFRKIPINSICFQIWKVNDDNLEICSKQQFGTFIDDCAYIVYAACLQGDFVTQDTIIREVKSKANLERYIHIWLGDNVNETKRSNVACKMQELDTYLNNTATEFRETLNNESARFLSYFKSGVIVKSGVLSNSLDENRLYKLCGRKSLYCNEMKSISWEYFGADYIMMLNTKNYLFVWMGRSSSNVERHNAIELAMKFQNNLDQITLVDDGYEQLIPIDQKEVWNKLLPLNLRVVCQNSIHLEKSACTKIKIYKICNHENGLRLEQIETIASARDDLNESKSVYVLDALNQGVWIWVGVLTSQSEKLTALGIGRAFVKKKKYPNNTQVIRVMEGYEPSEFLNLFPSWYTDLNNSQISLNLCPMKLSTFDSMTLCERPKMAAETQLIDDGKGEFKIFHFTKENIIEVNDLKPKYFLNNSSYVIQYSVNCAHMSVSDMESVGINEVIYQWNGAESSSDIISRAEKFARNLYDIDEKKSMFVQMNESDETPHFLQIFQGELIILRNEKNFKLYNNNNEMVRETCILKVYGDATYNGKAVEVFPLLSHMTSKDCYIIQTDHVWIWFGQNTTGDAREISKNIGSTIGEHTLVFEHKEPKEFWESVTNVIKPNITSNESHQNCNRNSIPPTSSNNSRLNNNGNNDIGTSSSSTSKYNRPSLIAMRRPMRRIQLFLVWAQRGKILSQEIIGFNQMDLSPECMYILDAINITYVWLGKYVSIYEKEKYLSIVQNYFATVPITRRTSSAVAIIKQDNEPNIFKGFFNNWKNNFWQNYVNYTKRYLMFKKPNDECLNENISAANLSNMHPAVLNNQKDFDRYQKYPIAVLQQNMHFLPAEINPLKREIHLSHDDFVSLFKMSFWEFDELPVWKQNELKKKSNLF